MEILNQAWVNKIVNNALEEDLGFGPDLTTDSIFGTSPLANEVTGQGTIIAKAEGVIAGNLIVERVFQTLNPQIKCVFKKNDGDSVLPGDIVMTVSSPIADILKGERTALNFFQRLSGVASQTRVLVDLISPYACKLLDTRKTTPGLRALEKYAVRVGGGMNHRMGLNDAVMIKDNHKLAAGSIQKALHLVKSNIGPMVKVSVEATHLEEALEAYQNGADMILLDNMSIAELEQAVTELSGKVLLEASGNITKENIVEVAKTGVDYISTGSITHSVSALDLSLNLEQ